MHKWVRGQHPVRIPETRLKRVLVARAAPVFQNLVPCKFFAFAACHIVDGYVLGSEVFLINVSLFWIK